MAKEWDGPARQLGLTAELRKALEERPVGVQSDPLDPGPEVASRGLKAREQGLWIPVAREERARLPAVRKNSFLWGNRRVVLSQRRRGPLRRHQR